MRLNTAKEVWIARIIGWIIALALSCAIIFGTTFMLGPGLFAIPNLDEKIAVALYCPGAERTSLEEGASTQTTHEPHWHLRPHGGGHLLFRGRQHEDHPQRTVRAGRHRRHVRHRRLDRHLDLDPHHAAALDPDPEKEIMICCKIGENHSGGQNGFFNRQPGLDGRCRIPVRDHVGTRRLDDPARRGGGTCQAGRSTRP